MRIESRIGDRPPAAWRRLAARAIDLATVATVIWVLGVLQVLGVLRPLSDHIRPEPWGSSFAWLVGAMAIATAYEVIFVVWSHGQTPGKDLMKLRVVGRDGARVGATRVVVRLAPFALVLLLRPWWLALIVATAFALVAAVPAGRFVTDLLVGTEVICYDRDLEDPAARRPSSRRRRRADRADCQAPTGDDPAEHPMRVAA